MWRSIDVATKAGWTVRIHHDGNFDDILARLAACGDVEFVLCRCPTGTDFAYFGTLWRLLPADDPEVGVFLSRDADDPLHAAAMDQANVWATDVGSVAHVQKEPYQDDFPWNMGWYGQKSICLPLPMVDLISQHAQRIDEYQGDEAFLRDILVPIVYATGRRVDGLRSNAYRQQWDYASAYEEFIDQTCPQPWSNPSV